MLVFFISFRPSQWSLQLLAASPVYERKIEIDSLRFVKGKSGQISIIEIDFFPSLLLPGDSYAHLDLSGHQFGMS